MNANEYNRSVAGRLWSLADLPPAWTGTAILAKADLDYDGALDDAERDTIAWSLFAEEVREVQAIAGLKADGKLGPKTLAALAEIRGPGSADVLMTVDGVEFRRAEITSAQPVLLMPEGRTGEERAVARAWNTYGAEIHRQAAACGVPMMAALAFFAVEASGRAYDPRTGLVIIRVEIPGRWPGGESEFRSRYGSGQAAEWRALQGWAGRERGKAFRFTSWGAPQTMGFNHLPIGYESPVAMALAYQKTVIAQIAGFFSFVRHAGLTEPIRNGDWRTAARKYNGPGQVATYAAAIARHVDAAENLQEQPIHSAP